MPARVCALSQPQLAAAAGMTMRAENTPNRVRTTGSRLFSIPFGRPRGPTWPVAGDAHRDTDGRAGLSLTGARKHGRGLELRAATRYRDRHLSRYIGRGAAPAKPRKLADDKKK